MKLISQLTAIAAGVFGCLWLLARVCAGATDIRAELRELGLDR